MSKEEQEMVIQNLNRRGSKEKNLMERSISNSSRYSEGEIARIGVPTSIDAYPDSPLAGRGMSKEEQEEQIRSFNRRGSKEAIVMQFPPANAASKYGSPSGRLYSAEDHFGERIGNPIAVAGSELDSVVADESYSHNVSEKDASHIIQKYDHMGNVDASIRQSLKHGTTNEDYVRSSTYTRPEKPFPDNDEA